MGATGKEDHEPRQLKPPLKGTTAAADKARKATQKQVRFIDEKEKSDAAKETTQLRSLVLRIARLGKKKGKTQLAILRGYLRAEGKPQAVEVRAMLDSGATGEFMTRRIAEMMGANITEGNFGFAIEAFGQRTQLNKKVNGAELVLPGVNPRTSLGENFTTKWDFIVAERLDDNYDLILGLDFMRKFGARFSFQHTPAQITLTDEKGREITAREDEHRESEEEELGPERWKEKQERQQELKRINAVRQANACTVRLTGTQRRFLRRATEMDADERYAAALRASEERPDLVMPFDDFIREWQKDLVKPPEERMKVAVVQALGFVEEDQQEIHAARLKIAAEPSKEEEAEAVERTKLEGTERKRADEMLEGLLKKFKKVFPEELPAGMPPDRGVEPFKIELKPGTSPFGRYGMRMTLEDTEIARKMLKELLDKGFIRPSQSPWGSPMFLVDKPDGTKRMVIDYRALNAATIRNRYPLPRVDELFDRLQGMAYFSKIDLRTGYWQIRIASEDVPKTAFTSRHGHYEWLVLPMGLTNAPASFMSLMENTFREELDKFVLVFLDDILIFSKTLEEHEQQLRLVLQRLESNRLFGKLSKCQFFRREVEFLGHMVGREGVRMVDEKVRAIKEWPTPTCQKEVEQFLGLAGYYRRFIKNHSKIAAPLSELTGAPKKGKAKNKKEGSKKQFHWGEEQETAFRDLKAAICTAPVLALPDPKKEFIVQTDASDYATGAVLMQRYPEGLRPIAFLSKKMDKAERNYPVHEQELLAIMNAFRAWRHYLGGRHFTVLSDHQSLQYVKTSELATPRQVRWAAQMAEFDFEIKYVKGEENVAADALSRAAAGKPKKREESEDGEELAITSIMRQRNEMRTIRLNAALELAPLPVKIADAAQRDPAYVDLLAKSHAELSRDGLSKGSGIIYKQVDSDWIMRVPNDQKLRTYLLQAAHDTLFGGHRNASAMTDWLKRRVFWQGMDEEVKTYVRGCEQCQRNKPDNRGKQGLPLSINMPDRPWACWCIDFIGPLPKTPRGHDMIMTVIDKFTRYAYYIPMRSTATAQEVFELLERYVLAERDVPEYIISDRDSKFTSHFWQSLWDAWGTKLKRSTAFHPQTDGLTERANRTLIEALRTYVNANQTDWDALLPWMQIANNDAKCQSTGKTPFEMNNGRTRRTLLDAELEAAGVAAKDAYPGARELTEKIRKIHGEAVQRSEKAQAKQREDSKRGRRESDIKQGDKVWLSTENLREGQGDGQRVRKLEARFWGPFEVLNLVGPNAARLELPAGWKIHNEINLQYLRLYVDGKLTHPDRVVQDDNPGPVVVENDPAAGGPVRMGRDAPEFEVEAIIGRKQRGKNVQYKVKWKGWPVEMATWERLENLENCMELVQEFEESRLARESERHEARTVQLANVVRQVSKLRDVRKMLERGMKVGARKSTPEQQQQREEERRMETEREKELARKAAREKVPEEETAKKPPIDADGGIKTPTQRCTAKITARTVETVHKSAESETQQLTKIMEAAISVIKLAMQQLQQTSRRQEESMCKGGLHKEGKMQQEIKS